MAFLPPEARLARGILADRFAVEGQPSENVLSILVPARDRLMEKGVTLELPRPTIANDKALLDRFVEGARAAMAIDHPGLVRVLGVEYDGDGFPFVVRERIKGALLSEKPLPLPAPAAWQILDPTLEALAAAHAAGLVHGALRPAQIVLHENARGALRPKIAGFGAAPLLRTVFEGAGPMAPRYAAPELFRGASPTPMSDVWAMGVIAVELLSGDHPVELAGATLAPDLARMLSERMPRSLARLVPSTPPEVVRAIDRALAVSPSDRWPNAGAMQAALVDGTRALLAAPRAAPAAPAIAVPLALGMAPPAVRSEERPVEPRREPTGRRDERDEPRREPTGSRRDDERARDRRDEPRRDATGSRRDDDRWERRDDERDDDDRRDARDDDRRRDPTGRSRREPTGRSRDERREPTGRSRDERREPTGRSRRSADDDSGPLPRVPRRGPLLPVLGGVVVAIAIAGIYFATRTPPEPPAPAPGTLEITNLPSGATATIDGAAAAAGPITLAPGHHHVVVAGFEPADVDVTSGTTARLTLEALPPATPPPPPEPTLRSRCLGDFRGGLDCDGGECSVRLTFHVTTPTGSTCGTVEWQHAEMGAGHADLGGCDIREHAASFEEPSSGPVRRISMRCTTDRTTVTAFDVAEGGSLTGSLRREGTAPPEAELVTPSPSTHPCFGSWSGFSGATGANVRFDLDALGDPRCGRVVDPDEGTFALSGCTLDGSMLEARSELGAVTIECEGDESGASLRSSTWGSVSLSPR